ncbi:hypothetical protein ACGFIV_32485 [Sphaerisporangium sp. NPDC049003]|uniref:hypothetical protein n=1 Tax=Sphaerisporangium sp. NPDC049003 TaxID=3364517 RepID=UPI0037131A28
MIAIEFSPSDVLSFDAARRTLRLSPGVAGARLEVILDASRRTERKDPPPVAISASMYVSAAPSRDRHFLTRLVAEHPARPSAATAPITLVGFIADQQIPIVETLRNAGRLWVSLDLQVQYVDEGTVLSRSGTLNFDVGGGEWGEELDKVDAGAYVQVVIPITDNATLADAARRIRKARQLFRENHIEGALGELRKVVEVVRKAEQTQATAREVKDKRPQERTQAERWAVFAEDTFNLLGAAVHDDHTTEPWTRASAAALIATVAGLLGRVAEADQKEVG